VVAAIFEKPSTRTRVSVEGAVARLGAHPLILSGGQTQLGRGETIEDTALVMSRLVDAIVIRTGPHETVEALDRYCSVPVVNALTHAHHPLQALADAMTLRERFGELRGLRVAYVGDGNNVCVSLMVVAALLGMRLRCGCPPGFAPDPELTSWAAATAPLHGGEVEVVHDAAVAAEGARALYTDVWVSMGDEEDEAERLAAFTPYRLDAALMARAAPDAVALHCLPAHDGLEITREVLHGPASAAWDQAENRLHMTAAVLAHLLPG
jgi:ornithine carbamoyltransferase